MPSSMAIFVVAELVIILQIRQEYVTHKVLIPSLFIYMFTYKHKIMSGNREVSTEAATKEAHMQLVISHTWR